MCSEEEMADSEQSLRQDMARYDKCSCRKITFKLKARVTEKSLNYIDTFWQSIADYFLLPSLPALLDSIHSGCVEVTWLVSTPSALQIQANIQDSAPFLQEHGVMRVVMDDEILYDEVGLDTVKRYKIYELSLIMIFVLLLMYLICRSFYWPVGEVRSMKWQL